MRAIPHSATPLSTLSNPVAAVCGALGFDPSWAQAVPATPATSGSVLAAQADPPTDNVMPPSAAHAKSLSRENEGQLPSFLAPSGGGRRLSSAWGYA